MVKSYFILYLESYEGKSSYLYCEANGKNYMYTVLLVNGNHTEILDYGYDSLESLLEIWNDVDFKNINEFYNYQKMDINYKLQKYYVSYLSNIKNLSVKSINNYLIALNAISRFLNKKNLIFWHIFEIYDIIKLEELRSLLYKDKDFIVINNRGHHMYSAGLNNYCNFANGLEFDKVHDKIKYMDMPIKANSERYKMFQ